MQSDSLAISQRRKSSPNFTGLNADAVLERIAVFFRNNEFVIAIVQHICLAIAFLYIRIQNKIFHNNLMIADRGRFSGDR